jgi:L-amino acid N-acyltransferase
MSITIRDATEDDLPGMLEIYNEVILNTTAVYSDEPQTLASRLSWYEERRAQGYPVFVAADESGVLGFSSYGAFRAWPAYRYTVEGSVYVRSDARGRGIGARLIPPLLAHARAAGKHAFIAGVDASNASSLRLHERFGFRQVAHFHEVGWKFGRWLDLLFLELILDETDG